MFFAFLSAGIVLALAASAEAGCSAAWGQCGGQGFTGATCCVSGYNCVRKDQYYSQCMPGGGAAPNPAPQPQPSPAKPVAPAQPSAPLPPNSGNYPVYQNVKATEHQAVEVGACSLPEAQYTVNYPVALGDIDSLQSYKFKPEMCGVILRINCGVQTTDIIVTNSNLGGGMDLYKSTWEYATGNKPPGITSCTVQRTNRNALTSNGPKCFYNEGWSEYYHNVALLNTNGKLVVGAKMGDGRVGAHRGANPYYAFDGKAGPDTPVIFTLEDGSTVKVKLGDCVSGIQKHIWK